MGPGSGTSVGPSFQGHPAGEGDQQAQGSRGAVLPHVPPLRPLSPGHQDAQPGRCLWASQLVPAAACGHTPRPVQAQLRASLAGGSI